MAGTIVTDRIESDASYASSINIASPMVVSNTLTMGSAAAITGNVNIDNGVLFVDGVNNRVGVGTSNPNTLMQIVGGASQQLEVRGTEADIWLRSTGSNGVWRILGSTNSSIHRFRVYDETNGRDTLNIDSSGRVTTPFQPAVFAQRTAGNYSSSSVIVFNDVLLNVGNHYSNSTGRFTAPVAGVYQIICHGIMGTGTNGSTAQADLSIRKNGSIYTTAHNNHTDAWDNSVIQCFISLAVNDFIEVFVSPTSPTIFFGANISTQAYNGLSITLIG